MIAVLGSAANDQQGFEVIAARYRGKAGVPCVHAPGFVSHASSPMLRLFALLAERAAWEEEGQASVERFLALQLGAVKQAAAIDRIGHGTVQRAGVVPHHRIAH